MKYFITLITAAVFCLYAFSCCAKKPMDEEAKLDAFCKAVNTDDKKYDREAAAALLEEAEQAIGTDEYKKIVKTAVDISYIDNIVCFKLTDGTWYFALYCKYSTGLVMLRVRKDNYMDGEVVWRRPDEGCVLSSVYTWRNCCVGVLEVHSGTAVYDLSYRLDKLENGEWEILADVDRDSKTPLNNQTRRVYYALPIGVRYLQPGQYRLILPVTFRPSDEPSWNKDIVLIKEFDVEKAPEGE